MECPACGTAPIVFSVPEQYREYVPASIVAFCPRCLTLEPAEMDPEPDETPAFARVGDAFPTRPERAIPLAIALDLAGSLATNRSAIESLLRDVERAGTDPLLVLDRLGTDPSVEPAIDLDRRRHQLEQLLY
ncbi:DUF6276 family protein [Halopiger djelfimassiliensis]|uniref:DUF6276 family protein n=1 Tax=Halopiger djelfimassiliensis TaxID=1293047 RepID=UPI000677D6A2|nr:DUF6276 family protein [Halopiger djelfimassiliensis]